MTPLPKSLSFLAPLVTNDLIRVGNSHDGGYVVPRAAIKHSAALLSFGVNSDWTFEKEFHEQAPTARIHTYDHTVSEETFLRAIFRGIVKLILRRLSVGELARRFQLWRDFRSFFHSNAHHFREKSSPRSTIRATRHSMMRSTGFPRIPCF